MTHPTNVNKPFAVVLYITDKNGNVLTTTRKNNNFSYGLVGGKVDLEDTCSRKALDREVYEETGVDISTIPYDNRFTILDNGLPVEAFIFNSSYCNVFPQEMYEGPEKTFIQFINRFYLKTSEHSEFWEYNQLLFKTLEAPSWIN